MEKRPSSPFLCTYMGRRDSGKGQPFRFILNHSKATATNVYLMLYPLPTLAQALLDQPELHQQMWQALNQISDQALMGEGRVYGGLQVYGGGLHKLEPRELGNVQVERIEEILARAVSRNS
jgi:hypothetical protein